MIKKFKKLPGTVLFYDVNAKRKNGIPKTYSSMELKALKKKR